MSPAAIADDSSGLRVCKDCGIAKPPTEFYKPRPDNARRTCKVCQNEQRKVNARKAGRTEAMKAAAWRRKLTKYGLTPEQYETMVADQNGVCWICEKPSSDGRRLHVDHDHVHGHVRGLLCDRCNRALGAFRDDPSLLRRAAHYLEVFRGVQ